MKLLFVDTETTGLKPEKGDRVIEICCISYQYDHASGAFSLRGRPWVQRFNPECPVPAESTAIHGITALDLRSAPKFSTVAERVETMLRLHDVFVAHNAQFDATFIHHELERCGRSFPARIQAFCTSEGGRGSCAMGKRPTLKELCWSMDVEYRDDLAHAAIYDTERLAECLIKGVQWGYFQLPNLAIAHKEAA